VLDTVTWGGDPNKPVEPAADKRPHPRRSFALWKEEVRLHSAPWTASDVEAAEELRRYAVEVDLERQLAREQRAVMARDELIAVVSHDLRNPLSVIRLQAQALLESSAVDAPAVKELREGAERTQRAAEQMSSLIDNLLDLEAIDTGRLRLRTQPIDVRPTVDAALETLRPLADAAGLKLVTKVDAGLRMQADSDRFYQVLSNLIGNAVKFTPSGGRIAVGATATGDKVTFSVEDTGPGIPRDQLASLFIRHGREQSEGDREGIGLGLFVVKGIVDAHGGEIRARSAPGHGATFVFTLPRA
jgi:two-component system, chemotaxis family, sensor kinase Cph1